ncbi:queuosine precursor transporter [Iamia majanohamensis]|uniref:Queuosine precursor transporter n=1 Tax=Iamia majanohamensis TaxID=467976 RepID=A0AAF0BUI8_9ACTN|nr:queuosine precursor transporter [Iamia majanohamensis]WCO65830.1 queuosine precursor transporter [Iamia majanohamensis]
MTTPTSAAPAPDRTGTSAPVVVSRAAVIAIGAYAGAQVIAQVTSLKIGVVLGRGVDMGTFVYPITFTLRDVVHKVAGRSAARTLILTCAGVNLFLAAYLGWTASVESDPSWGLGAEYEAVLGPIWRIVLASLAAMVLSELVDTEVYHWFVTRITTRFQWLRVLVSNAVSVPLDNLVFALGAFAPVAVLGTDGLPWATVWSIFWVNLWVKGLVSVASLPLIYATKDRRVPD